MCFVYACVNDWVCVLCGSVSTQECERVAHKYTVQYSFRFLPPWRNIAWTIIITRNNSICKPFTIFCVQLFNSSFLWLLLLLNTDKISLDIHIYIYVYIYIYIYIYIWFRNRAKPWKTPCFRFFSYFYYHQGLEIIVWLVPPPLTQHTNKHTNTHRHTLTYTHIFQPPAATPSMYYRGSTMYLFVSPPPSKVTPHPRRGTWIIEQSNGRHNPDSANWWLLKRKTKKKNFKLHINWILYFCCCSKQPVHVL